MRRLGRVGLVLLGLLDLASANAQPIDDTTACMARAGRKSVEACTRLIKSGKYDQRDQLYELYNYRGGAFAVIPDHKSAIADFTRAMERNKMRPHAFINRAASRGLSGDVDGAIADYTAALGVTADKDKDFKKGALNNRGDLYRRKGDLDHAIADFDSAIKIDASFVDALLNRGATYQQKGEYKSTISDYSKVIALNPRTALYYDMRAGVREAKGDLEGAIGDLSAAIKLAPGSAREPLVGRASLYFKTRQYDRAIEDYTGLIGLDPNFADFFGARAWCQYLRGRYALTIEDATKAIALGAEKANNYHMRGEAFRALRKFNEAIAEFNRALALDPRHFDSIVGRGEAYEARQAEGDHEKAIGDYRDALALQALSNEQRMKQAQVAQRFAALQTPPPPTPEPPPPWAMPTGAPKLDALSGRRIALLIGNQRYSEKVGPLKNPHNDVTLLQAALTKIGFETTVLHDSGYRAMDLAIKRYIAKLRDAGSDTISFFYYAGHGAANPSTRINYLIPVDITDAETQDLWLQSFEVSDIVDKLATQAPDTTHYVVFDACRDELKLKQTGRTLGVNRGFVPVVNTTGILIAFSTAPNKSASDMGIGSGAYARALAEEIVKPGQEAVTMFRNVQLRVKAAIGQDPWLSFPTLRPVFFAGHHHVPQSVKK